MQHPRWQSAHDRDEEEGTTMTDADEVSPRSLRRYQSYSSAGSPKSSLLDEHEVMSGGCGSLWSTKFFTEYIAAGGAVLLMLYCCVVYNIIFLGRVLPVAGKTRMVLPFAGVFDTLWAMTFWSWVMAHTENPGVIPQRWRQFVLDMGDGLQVTPSQRAWAPGKATFCNHCGILRPERAHHCSTCNSCVLRLDHHCPFVKNCVGISNHKYFLLLIVYAAATSVFALLSALPELAQVTKALVMTALGDGWPVVAITFADAILFEVFGVCTLLFATVFPPMMMMHIPLACHNQTKIENSYDNMPNPYDLGSGFRNLEQVMGAFGPDWFLPVRPLHPVVDGVAFPRGDVFYPEGSLETTLLARSPDGPDAEKLWRIRYQIPREKSAREIQALPMDSACAARCL